MFSPSTGFLNVGSGFFSSVFFSSVFVVLELDDVLLFDFDVSILFSTLLVFTAYLVTSDVFVSFDDSSTVFPNCELVSSVDCFIVVSISEVSTFPKFEL